MKEKKGGTERRSRTNLRYIRGNQNYPTVYIPDKLLLCDKVAPKLIENTEYIDINGNMPIIKGHDPTEVKKVCLQLIVDGYLSSRTSNHDRYYFTASCKLLFSNGGYEGKLKEEERIKVLQENQVQSVIDTNVSVKNMNEVTLPKNFIIQKNLTIVAIIIAAASAIISLTSLIKGCGEEKQQTVQLSQKPLSILDSMMQFQKGIDSSLRKVAIKIDSLKISK